MQDQSISRVFCDPTKEVLGGFSTQAFAFSKQYSNNILCKRMEKFIYLALNGTLKVVEDDVLYTTKYLLGKKTKHLNDVITKNVTMFPTATNFKLYKL